MDKLALVNLAVDTLGLKGKAIDLVKIILIVGFPDIIIGIVGIYLYFTFVRED